MPMRSFVLLALVGRSLAARVVEEDDVSVNSSFPQGNAWAFDVTKQLSHEEIGRCVDSDANWKWEGQQNAFWEAEFASAVARARASSHGSSHAQVQQRALKTFGAMSVMMPYHRAVILTTNRVEAIEEGMYYPDSHCFQFDYESCSPMDPTGSNRIQRMPHGLIPGGSNDPHGCCFFKKSFQPLKQLRQCIIGKLEHSGRWRAYKEVADEIKATRKPGSKNTDNPAVVDPEDQSVIGHVNVLYDPIRRADEIVKAVSFKPWETWDLARIKKEIDRKITKTVITKEKTTVLEPETVAAIRSDCFFVPDNPPPQEHIPPELLTIKKAMPCYQLMWDQVEVAGAPEQPTSNAASMWDPSLKYPSSVSKEHWVPPICARAALSLIAEKQKRAPGGYTLMNCLTTSPSWKECTNPKTFNCICFAKCFQAALRRMCELNSGCCDNGPLGFSPEGDMKSKALDDSECCCKQGQCTNDHFKDGNLRYHTTDDQGQTFCCKRKPSCSDWFSAYKIQKDDGCSGSNYAVQ